MAFHERNPLPSSGVIRTPLGKTPPIHYFGNMNHPTRRSCLLLGGLALVPALARSTGVPATTDEAPAARRRLPMETIFRGRERFDALVEKSAAGGWAKLPIGERVVRFAKELEGTPYANFTLEIDDRIESPSVNLVAVDCWSFFEQCLGLARMVGFAKSSYAPEDLLRQIEFTRYYGGTCSGNYLERIHYLADWFFENDARGACRHLTPSLPGAVRISGRRVSEMTTLWKSYRYLRNNPDLRPPMREIEERVERLPVYHIPKSKVAEVESGLRDGDVIGIATKHDGAFCSHVGLALRDEDGVARFLHASRDRKEVVLDQSVSQYLARFGGHAGILVGRPLEVDESVTDRAAYEANLKKLVG